MSGNDHLTNLKIEMWHLLFDIERMAHDYGDELTPQELRERMTEIEKLAFTSRQQLKVSTDDSYEEIR